MDSSAEKTNPLAKKLAKIQDNQFENDKVSSFVAIFKHVWSTLYFFARTHWKL